MGAATLPSCRRIDRLVALLVQLGRVAGDVGRERQPAVLRDRLLRRGAEEPHPAVAVGEHLERLDRDVPGPELIRLPGWSALPGLPIATQLPSASGWISSTSAGAPDGRVPSSRAWRTRVVLSTRRSPGGMRLVRSVNRESTSTPPPHRRGTAGHRSRMTPPLSVARGGRCAARRAGVPVVAPRSPGAPPAAGSPPAPPAAPGRSAPAAGRSRSRRCGGSISRQRSSPARPAA